MSGTQAVDVEKDIVVFPHRTGKRVTYVAEEHYRDLERKLTDRDAQCAAMRAALEKLWSTCRAVGYVVNAKTCAIVEEVLSTDAGKGWVSPEEHAKALQTHHPTLFEQWQTQVAENKKLRAVAEAVRQTRCGMCGDWIRVERYVNCPACYKLRESLDALEKP